VGKTWLLQAVDLVEARNPAVKFEMTIARSPFFLYPGGGHSIKPWGDRINALYSPSATQSIGALGTSAGYKFDFNVNLSDTIDSHRLVLWAEGLYPGSNKGEELAHGFGKRYFEQATPLADRAMLYEVVAETDGLEVADAKELLESERGYDAVSRAVEAAKLEGIHSIPVFVFTSGTFSTTVHGSADVEQFASVLDSVQAHWRGRDDDGGANGHARSDL